MVLMSGWIAGDVADKDSPRSAKTEKELQLQAA
jgi:hypothetical protein